MKISIKLKITLWFSIFMILLCIIMLSFVFLISNKTTTRDVRASLVETVDKNANEIEYDDGYIDIDDDFVSFRNGIYSLVFSESEEKLSGYSPYLELELEPFEDMQIRRVIVDAEIYLIYDKLISFNHAPNIWVRGIVSEKASINTTAISSAALIAIPILIILASIGGYFISKNSLTPIKQISNTAKDIGSSGDLSKRIPITTNDELGDLAQTFNQTFERLEKNFESERHFTSDAAHELRTPVATILAQCEYAFENATSEEELYESIGSIQKQGYRMNHLIESLLAFTRLEQSSKITLNPLNISNLVSSICDELSEFPDKNITLTKNIQKDVILNTDYDLFSRIVINLVRNSYKYGRENGNIYVSLKSNSNAVILSIEDDGIGIAPEDKDKIFNRFYRVDKVRNYSKKSGLGLGLAMVKEIVDIHNGKINVKSTLGEGSTFTITFQK